MGVIVKTLISILFVGVLCIVIYIQRISLIAEKAHVTRVEQEVIDRDTTINTLQDNYTKNKKALSKLQNDQKNIAAALSERELLIEQLQHDNITIRTWADTPLPDTIAKLRQRPATISANVYRQHLPASDALQPTSSNAQN